MSDLVKEAMFTAYRDANGRYEKAHNELIEAERQVRDLRQRKSQAETEKEQLEASYRVICGYREKDPVSDEMLNGGMKP